MNGGEGAALVDDLKRLPLHGPHGRIASVRRRLNLRQTDLAKELRSYGGMASRETVSHWENFDPDGRPRARVRRKNAEALSLAHANGLALPAELFTQPRATLDDVAREQAVIAGELAAIRRTLRDVLERLAIGSPNGTGLHVDGAAEELFVTRLLNVGSAPDEELK